MGPLFQVCIVVDDLEATMTQFTEALGFRWTERAQRVIDGDTVTVVFSIEGPPHIELVDGSGASGVWATGGEPRVHHLGFWSDDFSRDCAQLERAGLVLRSTTERIERKNALYDSGVCGTKLELIATDRRPWFLDLVSRPAS